MKTKIENLTNEVVIETQMSAKDSNTATSEDITIEILSESNIDVVLNLKIKPEQFGYCETVRECLSDAKKYKEYISVALRAHGEVVGFAMYGFFSSEGNGGRAWLDRIFIDERYQGKGYGKMGTKAMIKKIFTQFDVSEIYLSVFDNNIGAISLYKSLGFEYNGEKDFNGELVMTIDKKIAEHHGVVCD